MKVKLIGTGCLGTIQNSACSLVNKKILIDVPNGTCKELERAGEDINAIQTVIITHYHADHMFDLPFMILIKSLKQNKKLNVVGPKGIEKKTRELFELAFYEPIEEDMQLNFIEILPWETKYIEDTTIVLTHMREPTRAEAEKLENNNIIVPEDGYTIDF